MNYKETKKQWLADLPRRKLNNYINQCEKLLDEAQTEGNEYNIKLFKSWLIDAIFEVKRRDYNKKTYLQKKKII